MSRVSRFTESRCLTPSRGQAEEPAQEEPHEGEEAEEVSCSDGMEGSGSERIKRDRERERNEQVYKWLLTFQELIV